METVPVTTLDRLIRVTAAKFCKIDLEGFEFEVIKGLSFAIPTLSLEYTERTRPVIERIAHLARLGNHEHNYSVEESMVLARAD